MVDGFNHFILSLFDIYARFMTVIKKYHQILPWITDTIKQMINLRNDAIYSYRRTKSDVHKRYYNDLKNLIVSSISNEKLSYFHHLVNLQDCHCKVFWNNLKEKNIVDTGKTNHPEHFADSKVINEHFLDWPGSDEVPISVLELF